MARNRKYQSAAIRFGPALKAFLLCLVIGGSGVGYVWQKNQIYDLGQQIRRREKELAELESNNDKLKRYLAEIQSLGYLEMRIHDLNLGLVRPQPAKIWRLKETPLPERSAPETATGAAPRPAQTIARR